VVRKCRRLSLVRRTSTLPSKANQSRSSAVDGQQPSASSTAGGASHHAQSYTDPQDPPAPLSSSAPDLFTISTTGTSADCRYDDVTDAGRCDGGRRFTHAQCERYPEIVSGFGPLRPLMDTPVWQQLARLNNSRRTQYFTVERVHVVWGLARWSVPQKAEGKCEISNSF